MAIVVLACFATPTLFSSFLFGSNLSSVIISSKQQYWLLCLGFGLWFSLEYVFDHPATDFACVWYMMIVQVEAYHVFARGVFGA